jgi:hypothetical protein
MSALAKGVVEIYEIDNGKKTKIYEGNNIITKGFGYSLANLFSEQEDQEVGNFQIGYFQIGTSTVGYEPYTASTSFFDLSSGLTKTQYGSNLDAEVKTLSGLTSTKFVTFSSVSLASPSAMVAIYNSSLTRGLNRSNRYRLHLEKNMAIGVSATEFGLFIKNPDVNYKIDKPILAAYKKLNRPLVKSSDSEILIEWTISVVDTSEN